MTDNRPVQAGTADEELHDRLRAKLRGTPDFVEDDDEPDATESGRIRFVAKADFPTRFGHFTLYGFCDEGDGKELTAVVHGDVRDKERCPVRVHSECHTGDIWGSLRCDCRQQLEAALEFIAAEPFGAVIYLKQEGRGIGLLNKIKAYRLQDLGLDTVEANQYLGFPAENRDYRAAVQIMRYLEIRSVRLLTNNPDKLRKLRNEGVEIVERVPVVISANEHNRGYLETKRERMGHLL